MKINPFGKLRINAEQSRSIKNCKFQIANLLAPLSIILFAVLLRLIPHPANFAPIAALALFGGAYLNKKYALIVPLLAMVISDFFIGFHNTVFFVYGSFLLIGIIGLWLKNHKTITNIIFASMFSSVLFFVITNFGVWYASGLYPKNLSGLIQAYFYAIPFFRNTIAGDLLYSSLFFGSYELMLKALKLKTRSAKIKSIS